MGNTFGSNGLSDWLESACLVIEVAQVVVNEGEQPYLVADLFDSDALSGKHLAEVDSAFANADAPAMGDRDGAVVEWVMEFAQAAIRTR
jgi:hypothetical protein